MPNSKLLMNRSEVRQVLEWMLQTTIALFALCLLLSDSSSTPVTKGYEYSCLSTYSQYGDNAIEAKMNFSRKYIYIYLQNSEAIA